MNTLTIWRKRRALPALLRITRNGHLQAAGATN
jgi:hypothetical protein